MGSTPDNMTPMERVVAAMALHEPDRVPVIVSGYAFEVKFAGYTFPEILSDVEKAVDAKLRCLREFGVDAVRAPQVDFAVPAALGSKIRVFEDEIPAVTEPILKTPDDIGRLPDVDICRVGMLPLVLEVTKRLKEVVGPNVPVIGHTSLPFRTAVMLRGMQNLYRDLVARPAFAKAVMDYCVRPAVDLGVAMLEAGADVIFVTNPVASASCISRRHYEEFVHPYSKEVIARLKAKGAKLMFHYCGDWSDRMDLVSAEGPDIFHLDSVPRMSLGAMKARYGEGMCLMGNVRGVETLLLGNPQDVEGEARECIAKAGRGGGFILSANCAMPRDIPPANLHALLQAARVHGAYPLKAMG